MDKVVILCSGGLDSSVLAHLYCNLKYDVHLVYVHHGNINDEAEMDKVSSLAKKLGCELTQCSVNAGWWADSITMGGKNGYYVPMRNLVFASLGLSYAEKLGANTLALGLIKVPEPYNDSCVAFLDDVRTLALDSSLIHIEAPLIHLEKEEVLDFGLKLGIKLEDTISCSTPVWGTPCGKCADCEDIKKLKEHLAEKQFQQITEEEENNND